MLEMQEKQKNQNQAPAHKGRAGRLWIFFSVLFFICFCLLEKLSNGLYICFLALKSYQTVYLSDRNEKLIICLVFLGLRKCNEDPCTATIYSDGTGSKDV